MFSNVIRREKEIPISLISLVKEKRAELIECLANVDEDIGDYFLNEIEPSNDKLKVIF